MVVRSHGLKLVRAKKHRMVMRSWCALYAFGITYCKRLFGERMLDSSPGFGRCLSRFD